MTGDRLRRMWTRVSDWFAQNADHVTVEFLADPDSEPLAAYSGYVRLWLVEGFLAARTSWGNTQFPALHGGLALRFLGSESTPFSMFSRPSADWHAPGIQLDFPVTSLLPFSGGTVEVEAALYKASVTGPLGAAAELVGSLATLLGPPLAAAAGIAERISTGLDTVLAATGDTPVLGVHWAMTSAGTGGRPLRSGHLAVVGAPPGKLPGELSIRDGRLHAGGPAGPRLVVGADYLVLRVQCLTERDDWRFPELDELVRQAGTAYLEGQQDTYRARRTEAVVRAWNSADLIPADRRRVAKLVADEIDTVTQLGAVPGPARSLAMIAPGRLPAAGAPELADLRLADLL